MQVSVIIVLTFLRQYYSLLVLYVLLPPFKKKINFVINGLLETVMFQRQMGRIARTSNEHPPIY
jgi:cell shape-determining protein MreD